MLYAIRRVVVVVAATCALVCATPDAFAAGWPVASDAPVLCSYAEQYETPDGTMAVHTGVDVAADEGEAVLAIEAGTVTFAGSVPGSTGGTVLAVTVETASGEKFSYLPLCDTQVEAGDTVEAGVALGSVSFGGDASAAASHVHVGVRRGDRYIDPGAFLAAPAAVSLPGEDSAAPAPEVATSDAPSAAPASASACAPSAPPVEAASSSVMSEGDAASCESGAQSSVADGVCATADMSVAGATVSGQGAVQPVSVSTVLDHDPGAYYRALSVPARSTAPAPLSVESVGSYQVAHGGSGMTGLKLRVAFCLLCLAPIGGACLHRVIKSRVTALGDTVAAAVGR